MPQKNLPFCKTRVMSLAMLCEFMYSEQTWPNVQRINNFYVVSKSLNLYDIEIFTTITNDIYIYIYILYIYYMYIIYVYIYIYIVKKT